jgi:selenide, water dikinase
MNAVDTIRLTHLVECAGCASKMEADVLAQTLRGMPAMPDPNVLVGFSTADDAGVYRISDELAIVVTVDFFTPIVDDPRTFGRIAAANALSDIYAMGAKPLTAIAVTTFPEEGLDRAILAQILEGGASIAREAGIAVIGGHTVKDREPKYGLSVVGRVHPGAVVRNSTAKAGDRIVLTKPIGTGILTTSRRRDAIGAADLMEAIASMETLNRAASEAMLQTGVSAATDVTGFGLLGHLREMTSSSGVGAIVEAGAVPVFTGVLDLARAGHAPGGTRANLRQALEAGVKFAPGVDEAQRLVLCDAQTSGGLLISVPQARADRLLRALASAGVNRAALIGRMCVEPGLSVE